jgi:hypothetical protein
MNSYRDTWEYRLYEALSNVMEGTSNYDDIPEKDKEHALTKNTLYGSWTNGPANKSERTRRRWRTCPNKGLHKKIKKD